MSPTVKLGLLALITSASAAAPNYGGGHSRFHGKPSGLVGTGASSVKRPYPTGGWGGPRNSTRLGATGTGHGHVPGVSKGNAGASGVPGACGPATITVTATNAVTITVPAGGAPGVPSSAAKPVASSKAGYQPPKSVDDEDEEEDDEEETAPTPSAPAHPDTGKMSILPYSSAAPAPSKPAEAGNPVPSKKAESNPPASKPASSAAAPAPSKPAASSAAPAPSKASSSAASQPSSPSSGGGYSGSKRGLAYNDAGLCSKFEGGKPGFAYNWAGAESKPLPQGVQYVPLVHLQIKGGQPNGSPEKFQAEIDKSIKAGSKVVMGFNEPDQPEQANMSPEEACKYWGTYMNPIAEKNPNVAVIGPSVTNGIEHETKKTPMGFKWLDQFLSTCKDAKFKDLNIHFYQKYTENTLESFKSHCNEGIRRLRPGGKLWVTEFGFLAGQATDEQAATFLKGAIEYLESKAEIAGYAYFMVGNPVAGESTLLKGGALTPAGKVYASA